MVCVNKKKYQNFKIIQIDRRRHFFNINKKILAFNENFNILSLFKMVFEPALIFIDNTVSCITLFLIPYHTTRRITTFVSNHLSKFIILLYKRQHLAQAALKKE